MPTDSAKSRDKSPNLLSVQSSVLVRDLVRKRGIIKGRLTKFNNYLESLKDCDEDDFSNQKRIDLKLRIQGCTTLFSEFNDIQTKIEETVSDSELGEQLNQREHFEDSYYSLISLAEVMLNTNEVADCSKLCHGNSHIKSVKLPTISMPTFDGSYEHWLEFRDTFTSLVHNSKDISNIQKFHYLKSSLKGNAELVIHSIEFSSDNYQVAWELLLNRYNNCRLLVDNHIKALFTITALTKESPSLLRMLIDTIMKNLRALKVLGEPTESWDSLIIYIIVSKLDKITEREWGNHKCTLFPNPNENNSTRLSVDVLINFLRNRADMLEALQRSHGKDAHITDNKKQNTKCHNMSHCNVSSGPSKTNFKQQRSKLSCVKCNANHPLFTCKEFIESDLNTKLKLVREHSLCENCLHSKHSINDCKFGPCRHCNQKHNSLLHNYNANGSVALHSATSTEASRASTASEATAHLPAAVAAASDSALSIQVNKAHMQTQSIGVQSVLLSTAIVEVADVHGRYHKARVLLDNGSQRCFVSQSLCQLLNLPLLQSTNEVRGVGDSVVHCSQACNIVIKSCVDNLFTTRIYCYVLSRITASMPAVCKLSAQVCIPDNIRLADPEFLDYKTIDILIGADRFWDLLEDGKIRLSSGPFLQNTKLGWIISGPIINYTRKNTPIQCNIINSLENQLRLFWEIEEPPKIRDAQTEEERACEDHFVRTTTRDSEGRFCVHIPLHQSPDILGDSYTQAERRFLALEKRLQRSPEYKSLYSNFLQEYLSLGHMTQVDSYETPCYVMPHHAVYRELSTTTKLRVVFDASAPSSSVNEQSASTLDAEAAASRNEEPPEEPENRNGNQKMLRRMETVPDIKRDTSGITTQYIATGIVNLGAFAAGVCVAWSSSALPLLTGGPLEPPSPTRDVIAEENTTPTILSSTHNKLTLTAAEASWVASLLCLGALWGAGPTGLISEYFGRKKTLLYLALPLVVSWILVASSPNVYGLYVGRFVGGVALGAFSVGIPPYIEDIAESHILPTLANFYHVHFSCGVLFGYIIGLVENTSWLTVLCASIPTAFFIAFIFLPESPAYLMSQGKFHEAKAALRYFRGIDNDIDSEIKALKERLRTSAKIKVTFKELFGTRSTVKALIVSFLLMVFQQMSGIFPVLFYAKNIFETFSISLNPPSAAIILGFCFVSSTYFSTMLLKIARRRVLLMVSFAAMAVNLACLGIYYHLKASNISPSSTWVPLITLCLFVSFYASGVGPIPWLMLREIFPPHMTRRATALTAGVHWFLAFGVTKLYQNLVDMVKPGWTLWAFSISCLVGIVFVYFFVPETKGRSLQEIQNEFEGIHKKRKHRHVIEVESVSEA